VKRIGLLYTFFGFVIFCILFITFVLSTFAAAQVYYPADSLNVAWDSVVVPSGSTVEYAVYTRLTTQGVGEAQLRTTVQNPSAAVQFTSEGRYFVGVKAVRKVGGQEVASSEISWSDNATSCQGGVTFGAVYYSAPSAPKGLRKQ
jgi:hypothetical protein